MSKNIERGFVKGTMVILHLSDIHFGRNNPGYNVRGEFSNKNTILQELISSIRNNTLKPDHILVTGDIAWYGKQQDFDYEELEQALEDGETAIFSKVFRKRIAIEDILNQAGPDTYKSKQAKQLVTEPEVR